MIRQIAFKEALAETEGSFRAWRIAPPGVSTQLN